MSKQASSMNALCFLEGKVILNCNLTKSAHDVVKAGKRLARNRRALTLGQ